MNFHPPGLSCTNKPRLRSRGLHGISERRGGGQWRSGRCPAGGNRCWFASLGQGLAAASSPLKPEDPALLGRHLRHWLRACVRASTPRQGRVHFFHQDQSQKQTIFLENLGEVSRLKQNTFTSKRQEERDNLNQAAVTKTMQQLAQPAEQGAPGTHPGGSGPARSRPTRAQQR